MNSRSLRFASPAVLLLLVACSSSESPKPASDTKYLGLEAMTPESGFQVRSHGTQIPTDSDLEFCEVAEMPGDPSTTYYVNRIEFANGAHSHHLIIDAAEPGTMAEEKLAAMNVGDSVPCLGSTTIAGAGFQFVGGIQKQYGDLAFPEGVGRVYHGGQRFVFDYHYYNITGGPVDARSAVNFHLTNAEDVKHIAQVVGFANMTIDTAPGKTGSFMGECRYSQDVLVKSVTRHTHRWGTDFNVWYAGGAHDQELFWTSHNFQEDTDHPFDSPLLMKAGEGFRFQCDYLNTETKPLRFGLNATDEMCILFSIAWEAQDGENLAPQDCRIVQVDDDGVGRPVDPSKGFRPPTSDEVTACLAASPLPADCSGCACNACGGVIADCSNDVDCKAILDCVQSTGCDQSTCVSACSDAINQHSPGTGLLIQLSSCVGTSCSSTCTGFAGGNGTPTADAGAP